MPYISEQDLNYLRNKYHREDQPFDAFRRMAYHGYEYDPETGLDDAQMEEALSRLAQQLDGQPHPVYKARLFEYVLDHTRIDVNEHDYFIGLYSWNRPISKHCLLKWSDEVYAAFPEETARVKRQEAAGFMYGWLDFDHTVPDWDSLMSLGFPGILARATARYEQLRMQSGVTEKQEAFYRGVEIEYKAVIRFIDRLYQYACTKTFEKAPRIAQCLKNLRDGAPQCTFDALQMMFLYFMISESVEHYQVRSLGFGLDATLWPFFERDIESGACAKDEIASYLAYFMLQWQCIGNYWGQPFYLAGTDAQGKTKVNALSHLILEVYDKLGLYNPKIQIKLSPATPKDFVLQALEMIRGGTSSIVFCCEDTITKALMSRGYTYEEAVDSVISGCYEYKVKNDGIGMCCLYWNALKPVSLALDDGFDVFSGQQIGPHTGDAERFTSFKQFYDAYLTQLRTLGLENIADFDRIQSRVSEINPASIFSATMEKCVSTLTDALDGGITNNMAVVFSALGSAVDALMAINELVFEKKIVTMAELKKALACNWEGHEILRAKALRCRKYGNGDSVADSYAAAIVRHVSKWISGYVNSHGGGMELELHSARAFIIHGEKTIATPDGRKAGEETSKNASPVQGADRNGVTALIKSATTIDMTLADVGGSLDVMLHPSAVQGEQGLEAFYQVLKTYMNRGGASIHFNIFSVETLRDAQAHPEKYQNLQVRVCGWNVLFNNMDKREQDAYILRAENIR